MWGCFSPNKSNCYLSNQRVCYLSDNFDLDSIGNFATSASERMNMSIDQQRSLSVCHVENWAPGTNQIAGNSATSYSLLRMWWIFILVRLKQTFCEAPRHGSNEHHWSIGADWFASMLGEAIFQRFNHDLNQEPNSRFQLVVFKLKISCFTLNWLNPSINNRKGPIYSNIFHPFFVELRFASSQTTSKNFS